MKSEDVLDAFFAGLQGLSSLPGMPEPHRNETLDDGFDAIEGGAKAYLNQVDGDADVLEILLGDGGVYEMSQKILVEIIVQADTDAERRAALAGIVEVIGDYLVSEEGSTLSGACDACEIESVQRLDQAGNGALQASGWTLSISALFTSERPY